MHSLRVQLKAPLGATLRKACTAAGGTPLCGLLALFASLLMRLSESDLVVFGLPVVARPVASIVGYFSNDLPLCFTS